MLRSSLGSVRHYASIYAKVYPKRVPITHDFHKIIKWVPPEELRHWHPIRTCDLQPLPKPDPNALKLEYRPFADVIEKLPEDHRKLFTVEYGNRKDGVDVILEDTLSLVRCHLFESQCHNKSLPHKIAWSTIRIRSFQEAFTNDPYAKRSGIRRKNCKELIDKRKKWLRKLRKSDYKCFEWILEVLGIIFKPDAKSVRIQRNASIDLMVNMLCNEIREKKMKAYKDLLESEKIPFLEMKLDTLHQIKADEDSINIQCSVQEDIESTKIMLENLKRKSSSDETMTIHPIIPSTNQITS